MHLRTQITLGLIFLMLLPLVAQKLPLGLSTEIGITSTNELNALINYELTSNRRLELKVGWHFKSRLLSHSNIGFNPFFILSGKWLQEHQSLNGVFIEPRVLFRRGRKFEIGPGIFWRMAKAHDVKVIMGYSEDDVILYDLDGIKELGLVFIMNIGGNNNLLNYFISGGIRRGTASKTKYRPYWSQGKEDIWYTRPLFNTGMRINLWNNQKEKTNKIN